VAHHVLQDHGAALQFRQLQESLEAKLQQVGFRHGQVACHVFRQRHHVAAGTLAQEVQARIVGDAQQPAAEVIHRHALGPRAQGLDQGILQHIFAIHGGAGHAGAIAVQPRPQLLQARFEVFIVHASSPRTESKLASSRMRGK
jgi:hypothetical protein